VVAVLAVQDCTAAGGENDVLLLRELIDDRDFTFAETGFAFFFEDQRDICAGALFDNAAKPVCSL